MRKQGGGFGVVVLLVVVAIMLLLAARSWKAVMPTAQQALKPGSARTAPDHAEAHAGESVAPVNMPNLDQMKRSTGVHKRDVQDGLDSAQ